MKQNRAFPATGVPCFWNPHLHSGYTKSVDPSKYAIQIFKFEYAIQISVDLRL